MVATGASIGTVEAALGIAPNQLSRYLAKGKANKNTPYRHLYNLYRQWAANARYIAESKMVEKTPEKWLDRNTSAKLIETSDDNILATQEQSNPTQFHLGAQQAIDLLAILQKSGISIDDALAKNQVSVSPAIESNIDESSANDNA